MITLIVWAFMWALCGKDSDIVMTFTDVQMATFFLICVASDLNIIIGGLRKGG